MRKFLLGLVLAALPALAKDVLPVLDDNANIYYPDQNYPRLTTPQWIGEEGVDAAAIFAIDDMRDVAKYENYIRPILERLKKIDGRAPLSIMTCNVDPQHPQLQAWIKEGVSLEVHTIDHPCPILAKGDLAGAKSTYDRCVDLMFSIPNNHPVAFRTPCMDGINSASPRLFAEILNRTTTNGHFLTISSSVGVLLTPEDPENPRELVSDKEGKGRFDKYILPGWINYIKDYPYPYVVGNRFWEAGYVLPDDYEGSRVAGDKSPATVDDMQASIDIVAAKKGLWVMTFHPYQWITNSQVVQLIDRTTAKHGSKVKFLNFREAQERIDRNLLAGQPLRRADGSDNGIRLLDLNRDGFLDVVIGNESMKRTRVWQPKERRWIETTFPTEITTASGGLQGVHFGTLTMDGNPVMMVANDHISGLWSFDGREWKVMENGLAGLHLGGEKVLSAKAGKDFGVRFRDVDGDGVSELIVSNPKQNAIFAWNAAEKQWKQLAYGLPAASSIVDEEGRDNGVRFVDFNGDGHEDVIYSNAKNYGLALFVPKDFLGFKQGFSRAVVHGKRGDLPEIPMIVREGEYRENGSFFTFGNMYVQNEDTDKLTNLVQRVSFAELLDGFQPQGKSPKDSLQSMTVTPGYEVEVVAQEPAVQDPVYLDWSADGRLWVVEMRDYPRGIDGKKAGAVRCLEDQDGDGFYEKSTVFLSDLNYPNGLAPWKNGVLISAAPDILYAEDTDRDGRADHVEVLFTGFREGNQQHRANGYEFGLDGWFYGANGDSGGEILSKKTGKRVSIGGRDFRFKPDTGEFEAISGNAQYGRRRDDWGNWYGGANYTWGWNYFLEERYLSRNPNLAVRGVYQQYAQGPDAGRVFPISRVQQRFNDIGMAGHVTSACSFSPYRDDLCAEFVNSIFISEPTHNLVHREVLEPEGVTFRSHRAETEKTSEFLASRDPWFRPTTIKTGPDGAVYVCDMYRLVIEHPEWIPQDVQSRMNLRAGEGMGRIYRVRPKGKALRKIPNIAGLHGVEIARALDSSNGWQRDTVERLIWERQDKNSLPELQRLAAGSSTAKVRLQALYCLEVTGGLRDADLNAALNDPHPAVREHAIRLCESALRNGSLKASTLERLLAKATDDNARVRYQLAFTLGEWKDARAVKTLAAIAVEDSGDRAFVTAVMSSSAGREEELLNSLLDGDPAGAGRLVSELLGSATKGGNAKAVNRLTSRILAGDDLPEWKVQALGGILAANPKGLQIESAEWQRALTRARKTVSDSHADESRRIAAIQLLGHTTSGAHDDAGTLAVLLRSEEPLELQHAALHQMERLNQPEVASSLLAVWRQAGAQTRAGIAALLLRREEWTRALLKELKEGSLAAADFGPALRQQLLEHRSDEIRKQAHELFAAASSNREAVVHEYLEKVRGLGGDPGHGRAVFEAQCALCHKAGNLGTGAGPNLAMLYDRGPEQILTAILDPNRAVEDKYRNYIAELKNGEEVSGLLAAETGNSITIIGINGVEQQIMRRELQSLQAQNRSLMPEGFEQFLQAQDFADLIRFIQTSAGRSAQAN